MKVGKYPIIIGETAMVYEFISEGIRGRINKLVIYSETHLHNFYNLGFGDKDEETGNIDDEVVTNNGDSEKVLATVASTLYIFTEKFPEAMIFATGSTKARTRLYRIGISNNIEEIEIDFEVFGLVGENWQRFQKQIEFDAFLVKRKKK
ncbi:MAG: hypothetical protein JWQ09_4510 [Segetibacter sp.]|nr:hypothetical protein [Segetibacter sp.]